MKKNKLNEINKIFLIFMIGSIIGYIVLKPKEILKLGKKIENWYFGGKFLWNMCLP